MWINNNTKYNFFFKICGEKNRRIRDVWKLIYIIENLEWNDMLSILLIVTRNKMRSAKVYKGRHGITIARWNLKGGLWSLTSLYPLGTSQFLSLCGTNASSYWNKSYYILKTKRNPNLDSDLLLLSPACRNEWTLGLDFKSHKQHYIQMTREIILTWFALKWVDIITKLFTVFIAFKS